MSHSKRNTSLPHFTHYERSQLSSTWGSQRTRLTRDSFLPFGSCRLCLSPAKAPVVACPSNGDIFCKECAISNLVAQRKEIARLEKEREEDKHQRTLAELDRDEEAGRRALEDFEKTLRGEDYPGGSRRREEDGNGPRLRQEAELPKKEATKRKAFELDEREMSKIARGERDKIRKELEDERSAKSSLASFWIPSLTPSISNGNSHLPKKLSPVCPASTESNTHPYSLKTLVTVNFTEEKDSDTGLAARICPSCKKGLSNARKAILAKPCGHVICKPCVEKFMKPSKDTDPHDSSSKREDVGRILCYVCESDVTDKKKHRDKNGERIKEKEKDKIRPGLVEINSDGTGFAGMGQNMAGKEGVAFQC